MSLGRIFQGEDGIVLGLSGHEVHLTEENVPVHATELGCIIGGQYVDGVEECQCLLSQLCVDVILVHDVIHKGVI